MDGYEPEAALAILEVAGVAGVSSVLDVESGDPDVLGRMLALGAHAILPLGAGRTLTGRMAPGEVLAGLGALTGSGPQLVVTAGTRGSWAIGADGMVHQPAFHVQTVDTTGCGDVFHGAYASALLDGLPLRQRLEFAALIASRVALGLGGRGNLPTRASLRAENIPGVSGELQNDMRLS